MLANPVGPRTPNGRRQHELVPELEQQAGFDEEAHVVLGSLPQHLLVDTRSIAAIVQVVVDRAGTSGCYAPLMLARDHAAAPTVVKQES